MNNPCLIVDVNVAARVLLADDDPDFRDIYDCLFKNKQPKVRLAYSSVFVKDCGNQSVNRMLTKLDQQGRAMKIDDELVEKELEIVTQIGLCKSNDEHIIALARAGKVRLLCSHDNALQSDFKNKSLLDNPRGKVYKNRRHKRLLEEFCR